MNCNKILVFMWMLIILMILLHGAGVDICNVDDTGKSHYSMIRFYDATRRLRSQWLKQMHCIKNLKHSSHAYHRTRANQHLHRPIIRGKIMLKNCFLGNKICWLSVSALIASFSLLVRHTTIIIIATCFLCFLVSPSPYALYIFTTADT